MSRPVLTKHSATPAKPFSSPGEALRKRATSIKGLGQQRGVQSCLRTSSTRFTAKFSGPPCPAWQTWGQVMTEVVIAVLAFLSVGVFLAHAFDAYRTGAVGTRNPRY